MENLVDFITLGPADDHGNPLFEDPCFFGSNQWQAISQKIHVIPVNVGNGC